MIIIVAISKLDGHIYQSNPATDDTKVIVKENIIFDMASCGLTENDYSIEERTETEFYELLNSLHSVD